MAHYAFLNKDNTVTQVITGVEEINIVPGNDENINQEIQVLEESKKNAIGEDLESIQNDIRERLDLINELPEQEIDNTVYWEEYYGKGGKCKRTSYNTIGGVHQNGGTPFRKNYAGVGMTYDPVRDAFYSPQLFESWTLNEDTCLWEAPAEKPEGQYWWKEDTAEWVDYEYYSQPLTVSPPDDSWSWSTEKGKWVFTPVLNGDPINWDEENQTLI